MATAKTYTVLTSDYIMYEHDGVIHDDRKSVASEEHGTFDNLKDAVDKAAAIAADPSSCHVSLEYRGCLKRMRSAGVIDRKVAYVVASEGDNGDDSKTVYETDALDQNPEIDNAFKRAVHARRLWLDYETNSYLDIFDFL